jgi:L-ascorbate metabolism protein UlaG (beta-lactamase superfamily)
MGYEDAVRAARMIDCKNIIGVHYDTFGFIKIDHEKAKKAFNDDERKLQLLKVGETIKLQVE